jgi:hypothetical protein
MIFYNAWGERHLQMSASTDSNLISGIAVDAFFCLAKRDSFFRVQEEKNDQS